MMNKLVTRALSLLIVVSIATAYALPIIQLTGTPV